MDNNSNAEFNLERLKKKITFGIKCWLEFEEEESKNILGSGWAKLLESIDKPDESGLKSLKKAAKECGYSYKYAWSILRRISDRTGFSPVETGKGGPGGGGWIKLNEWGKFLLKTYSNLIIELKEIEKKLEKTLKID
jgi:molybdate transport repressor ModE-like protein